MGSGLSSSGDISTPWGPHSDAWELYVEPRRKKIMHQAAYRDDVGFIRLTDNFFDEDKIIGKEIIRLPGGFAKGIGKGPPIEVECD
jgi:hypothetical protein